PEGHAHLAVHRGGGGQMLLCLRLVACAAVERAEAEVAVGDEGAHPQFAGERQRLAVLALCGVCVDRLKAHRGFGLWPTTESLYTALMPLTGDLKRPASNLSRVGRSLSTQVHLAQPGHPEGQLALLPDRVLLANRFLNRRQGFGCSPSERVSVAECTDIVRIPQDQLGLSAAAEPTLQ